jgi:hypothetical protein
MLIMSLLVITVGFSSFTAQVQYAYGLRSNMWVVIMIGMQNFLFLPMNFVSAKVFKEYRMHHILYVGTVVMLIGCWLRILSIESWNFTLLMTSTIIALLPCALFFNSISLIVNHWCAEEEKGKGTAFCSVAIPMGTVLGLAISGIVSAGMDPKSIEDCQERTKKIIWIQNYMVTIFAILFLSFFKEKPDNPPSKSSLFLT